MRSPTGKTLIVLSVLSLLAFMLFRVLRPHPHPPTTRVWSLDDHGLDVECYDVDRVEQDEQGRFTLFTPEGRPIQLAGRRWRVVE
jgi:hypothetical protein